MNQEIFIIAVPPGRDRVTIYRTDADIIQMSTNDTEEAVAKAEEVIRGIYYDAEVLGE